MLKIPGKFCRGQAITELMACLIGVCFVVLGMLFVSVAGSKGVRNILTARKDAERNMVSGMGASGAGSISIWYNIESGQGDGLHFTADDTSFPGNAGSSGLYRKELVSSGEVHLDVPFLAAGRKNENYIPFSVVESNQLFLQAADLKEGKASETDPLGSRHLHDLKLAMRRLGIGTNITIEDKLYLPGIPSKK